MKKKLLIGAIVLIILGAIASMIYASVTLKGKEKKLDEKLVELNFNELEEKLNKKESFILVITQTNCSHCAEYKPVLKQVLADYNITAYEIDETKLSEEDNNKLKEIANVSGTPTTIFIENGEEQNTSSRITGSASRNKIINRFKAMGYINE